MQAPAGLCQGEKLISLRSMLSRGPAPMLGLDIGASSLKLVELERKPSGQLVLQRCASEPMQPGWVVDGKIRAFDEIAQALKQLLSASASPTRRVAMALPTAAVLVKKIRLPAKLQPQALQQQVETAAAEYFPFPLDECHLDYGVAETPAPTDGLVDVEMAVARMERVLALQELAQAAGLTPWVVDSHAFAARHAISRLMDYLPQGGESQTLAFFELGCESSSLQIRCAGQFVHHREMAVGGAALTQEIASRQGGTWAQAEQQKIHAHRSAPWVKERVAAFVDKLTTDLSQALQAFNREGAYPPVTHVMLAGGSAELAGLVESLGARVHAPCVLLDPFVGMTPGAALCAGQIPHKPAYLTACGLALRRFLP